MSKVTFKLDLKGLNDLMKSPEMQEVLSAKGAEIASRAGDGYAYRTHLADYVAITNVYPDTKEAADDNYKNNSLLKAIGND